MNTSPMGPRVDAADLLASLSAQVRKAVEQTGTEDVAALACEALARYTPREMKTGPSGRVSDADVAEAYLDHARPLVSTVSLAGLMHAPVSHPKRAPTGVLLPAKAARELSLTYVVHRVCADMRACPEVRRQLLELRMSCCPYNAMMIASKNVDRIRWELRCCTVRKRPSNGLPPRPKWFRKAAAMIPATHYSISQEAAQVGVGLLLAVDQRRYRALSAGKFAQLRSLLTDIAFLWEAVKPTLDEAAGQFYSGRYMFGIEDDRRLREPLRRLGSLYRRAERAAGPAGLRKLRESFDYCAPPAGARLYTMTVAYEWVDLFS